MKRLVRAALVALSLVSALSAPNAALAHWRHGPWGYDRHWHPGRAAAFGALTGFALGTVLSAGTRPTYTVPAPVYTTSPFVKQTCFTGQWREWVPGWGWQEHRRTVCH